MGKTVVVADYMIHFLGSQGVRDIFEVYGAANGDLIDAFTRTDETTYVSVIHEQAGGFAAEGYAKISGRPAASISTSGPGGQNFVTPIANFYYDSVPGIFITGQVHSKFMRPDESVRQRGFQETPIVEIVRPITKYAKMVTDPHSIRYEMEKAWHIAQDGRPGPVLLDMPLDVQKARVEIDSLAGYDPPEDPDTSYDLDRVDRQIDLYLDDLARSLRPSIFVGGGVRISGGIEALLEVSDKLGIPMFPTWNAFDVVTDDHPCFGGRFGTYGGKGRNFGIQNSDLVLGIGSRVSGRLFGSNEKAFLRAARRYLVNTDRSSLNPEYQEVLFDENVHCDARLFLERLSRRIDDRELPGFGDWMAWVAERRDRYDPVEPRFFEVGEHVHPYAFMRVLSQKMAPGDIFVGDCGGNIATAGHAFETKRGQRFLTNNGNSPMGFAFAGAMGAWLASNRRNNTVCVIGDGGFQMNLQELQTIKNYGIGVKTFISNNHCYGITRQFQRTRFEGRQEACGPKGYSVPEFTKIVEAYGIPTITIDDNSELESKIGYVLEHDGPIVADVNCGDWDHYEPRVFGGRPIEEMHPFLSQEEFEENMIIEPWGGGQREQVDP